MRAGDNGGRRRDSFLLLGLGELMDLIKIYECFCDRTRLRILHLLPRARSASAISRRFLTSRR